MTEKAFSVNVGMDVCLGLYDDYYFFYVALGIVEDDTQLSVERILGDADGNGTVTVVDATCIQRYLAGSAAGAFHEAAADADEDTTITIIDATYIQRWLADLPSNSRIGQTMPQHADA